MKCNFLSLHLNELYFVRNLLISRGRIGNVKGIGCETKKLWLSIVPVRRRPDELGWRKLQNGVNYHFSLSHVEESYVDGNLSNREA